MGTWAELGRRERMVIVEFERGWWVVIRAGVRSFCREFGSGHKTPRIIKKGQKKCILERAHSLTTNAAPLQTPFSIVSYLNNGPTINCKCGFVFATLKFRDLSVADIDDIDCKCELDVSGDEIESVSVYCWAW